MSYYISLSISKTNFHKKTKSFLIVQYLQVIKVIRMKVY